MRYYHYISDSKLEMLYEQIPKKQREEIARTLSFDFGLVKTNFTSLPVENARHQKIEITRKHLQGRTGKIGEKRPFIYGTAVMAWGPYDQYDEVVYFGGNAWGCQIGLMGSMRNCLGFEGLDKPRGYSSSGHIVALLSRKRWLPVGSSIAFTHGMPTKELEDAALGAVWQTNVCSIRPSIPMEFFAKTIAFSPAESDEEPSIYIGSPLFVAEVDHQS